MVLVVEGVSVMTKLHTVSAVSAVAFVTVAFVSVALIAPRTYGHVEPQPPAQISPLQMMTGQHLQQTEMTDMSLVFAR
jgi:hypothetical protein